MSFMSSAVTSVRRTLAFSFMFLFLDNLDAHLSVPRPMHSFSMLRPSIQAQVITFFQIFIDAISRQPVSNDAKASDIAADSLGQMKWDRIRIAGDNRTTGRRKFAQIKEM